MTASGSSGRVIAGADNLARLRKRLARHDAARAGLAALGVDEVIVDRFSLGLKEPYRSRVTGRLVEDAIAFPVMARGGGPTGRYAYWPLEGVTLNAIHPAGWGPGDALPYFSGPATGAEELVVVSDPVTMWLMADAVAKAGRETVIVTKSHPRGMPFAWTTDAFWEGWERVILALDRDDRSMSARDVILSVTRRDVLSAEVPADLTLARLLRSGASKHELTAMLDRASVPARHEPVVALGDDFDVRPIAATGAWIGRRMYYPFRVERRTAAATSNSAPVLTEYATLVLRSDGKILEARELPAPPSTPKQARVFSLDDGTRVEALPFAGPACSWSPTSIRAFLEARRSGTAVGARPLPRILADVELYLRSVVWLPDDDAYALITVFVAMSHCHRIFPVLPILLVNGPHGSGKSELGQACADLGFNGTAVGQVTAAAFVRVVQESRGLVVLDDLERISGRVGGVGDVSQLLKVGYKAGTARRVVADAGGGVRTVDMFGPRVVTNIGGADEVLRSRMVTVRTARLAATAVADLRGPDVDRSVALRDELHTWAFDDAENVEDAHHRFSLGRRAPDRAAEIMLPLLAIADLAGEDWSARVRRAAERGSTVELDAAEVLVRAIASIRRDGGGPEVSITQLALQCALEAGPAGCPGLIGTPDALGRHLVAAGFRSPTERSSKARLHGRITRIYRLSKDLNEANPEESSEGSKNISGTAPFDFCTRTVCAKCRYDRVCDSAAPGLKRAKISRPNPLRH